jgi:hypothetical protein
MNTNDARIIAQVAAAAAATIHSGTGDTTGYVATVEMIQADLLARAATGATEAAPGIVPLGQPIVTGLGAVPVVSPTAAIANVQAGFPGATVQPAPVAVVAPPAAVGGLPFPTTGNDQEDKMWADLIANQANWYNNITDGGTSYTGGTKPDFRHKTAENAKGDKFALWLVSRRYGRTAPDAVFAALGLSNPGAVAPVPAATGAFPVAPRPDEAPF